MATTNSDTPPSEPVRKKDSVLNVRVVLNAVRRWPLAFAGTTLLAAGAAVAVWFFLPLPKMTGVVVFHVAAQRPSVLVEAGEGQASFQSYKQSQAALVKSRRTLGSALNEQGVSDLSFLRTPDAARDKIGWLERMLTIDAKSGAEFMRVTLEGDNEEELKLLLRAVAKAYLADVDSRDNGQRRLRLVKLEETIGSHQKQLSDYHKRINVIASALGSNDGPTLVALNLIHQEELREALRDRRIAAHDLELARGRLAAAEAGAQAGVADPPTRPAVSDADLAEVLRQDLVMQDLEAEVARAERTRAETEQLFEPGASPPAVVQAREQVKAAAAKRDKYRADRRPAIEAQLAEAARREADRNREAIRQAVEHLQQKVLAESARVKAVQDKITDSSRYRLELEGLNRDIATTEKFAAHVAEEANRLRVELGAAARVTQQDEPFVVQGLEGNRRLKYTLAAGLGTFLAGFAGLVWLEHRGRRVTSTAEVTADLGVRLLGTVPPTDVRLPPATASKALVEAVDTARTMLLHCGPAGGHLRTVIVTSAVAQEGKTSLSGHLAISLARAGFRTLLIDGDLHSPSAHRVYGLPPGPGLCELLRDEAGAADVTHGTPIPNLSIIPAGRWDMAARQSLVGERWQQVRQVLESQYDFLVVDTAPLLLVTDTLLFARSADAVVLSVLYGVSQVAHVAETATRLKAIGANLTGTVVNGVWHKAYHTAYSYGYGRTESAAAPNATAATAEESK